MEQFIHTFRDNGNLSVYNDDVMPRTFDLEGSAFRFNLFPSNETKGWRFGIVLSEDENFSHLPFKGRYNDKTLRFMQANFNRKNANGWILENRVYLEMFNVDNENVIPWEFPQQKRPEFIRVELRRAANNNDLIFLVKTNEKDFMCRPIPLPGYRYFKLAVWADESHLN